MLELKGDVWNFTSDYIVTDDDSSQSSNERLKCSQNVVKIINQYPGPAVHRFITIPYSAYLD